MNARRNLLTLLCVLVLMATLVAVIYLVSGTGANQPSAPPTVGGSKPPTPPPVSPEPPQPLITRYENPLLGDIGPEWNFKSIIKAPGGQKSPGDFAPGHTPELELAGLPPH